MSITGVLRAPVAIVNFCLFFFWGGRGAGAPCMLHKLRDIHRELDAKLVLATGARTTPIVEIPPPPLVKNPFVKLIEFSRPFLNCESQVRGAICANRSNVMKIEVFLRIDSRKSILANCPDSRCESTGHLRLARLKISVSLGNLNQGGRS